MAVSPAYDHARGCVAIGCGRRRIEAIIGGARHWSNVQYLVIATDGFAPGELVWALGRDFAWRRVRRASAFLSPRKSGRGFSQSGFT